MPRRIEAAVERGMDRTAAMVQDGMNEVKAAASLAREILQRFLDAGEIRLKFGGVLGTLLGNKLVIPIPPEKTDADNG